MNMKTEQEIAEAIHILKNAIDAKEARVVANFLDQQPMTDVEWAESARLLLRAWEWILS